MESQSVIGGEEIATQTIDCIGWSIVPSEVFRGPFGGKTKNPTLFVSNTMDPITPITNGQKEFPKYRGAELLTIEGQGHSSFATRNWCAWKKIGTFFQTRVLPGNDNYCPQEAGAFGITLPESLEKRDDWNIIRGKMQELSERRLPIA